LKKMIKSMKRLFHNVIKNINSSPFLFASRTSPTQSLSHPSHILQPLLPLTTLKFLSFSLSLSLSLFLSF
jgi:hypothetical protein